LKPFTAWTLFTKFNIEFEVNQTPQEILLLSDPRACVRKYCARCCCREVTGTVRVRCLVVHQVSSSNKPRVLPSRSSTFQPTTQTLFGVLRWRR